MHFQTALFALAVTSISVVRAAPVNTANIAEVANVAHYGNDVLLEKRSGFSRKLPLLLLMLTAKSPLTSDLTKEDLEEVRAFERTMDQNIFGVEDGFEVSPLELLDYEKELIKKGSTLNLEHEKELIEVLKKKLDDFDNYPLPRHIPSGPMQKRTKRTPVDKEKTTIGITHLAYSF
jgi:hypothetical protein